MNQQAEKFTAEEAVDMINQRILEGLEVVDMAPVHDGLIVVFEVAPDPPDQMPGAI